MLLFFGTRSKLIESKRADESFNCSYCDSFNTVRAYLVVSYFHLFWIPIFPYSKKIITECSHCKNLRRQNEINQDELTKVRASNHLKTPWGYYTGLILIAIFIVLMLVIGVFGTITGS